MSHTNTVEAVRQLQAFAHGQPTPRGTTLHFPLDSTQTLIVAWCRMGGESRPWGVAWQEAGRAPEVRTVPEPRDHAAVAEMLRGFAPVMLRHFGFPHLPGPKHVMPQIWLPNPSHLEMLRFIAYSYTFAQRGNAAAWPLRALGRVAGFITREASRMPLMAAMIATDCLRETFTFPVQPARQHHLGFLLAWLNTPGSVADKFAAAALAEQEPVSITLDSKFERDELAPRVTTFNEARRLNDATKMAHIQREIHAALEPKLLERLHLTSEVMRRLQTESEQRPINPGIATLGEEFTRTHFYDYLSHEQRLGPEEPGTGWAVSPETDRQLSAAMLRFFTHNEAAGQRADELLPHDGDLQMEAVAAGNAFMGHIVRVADEGTRRKRVPVWTVVGPVCAPLRVREGQTVAVAAWPKRMGVLRHFTITADRHLIAEIEITHHKLETAAPSMHRWSAADRRLLNAPVVMFAPSGHFFDREKRRLVRSALTRAGYGYPDTSEASADPTAFTD